MTKFEVGNRVRSIGGGGIGLCGVVTSKVSLGYYVQYDNGYVEGKFPSNLELIEEETKMFTKKDLKIGMMVELRGGGFGILMPNIRGELVFIFEAGAIDTLSNYANDLKHDEYMDCDIVKVFNLPKDYAMGLYFNQFTRELLYDRKQVVEITMEELSTLLGYEVKIKK